MRKTIVVITLLALAWLGYVAWPIYTLGTLARAIETGDQATALHHVDLPAVRQSITDQVVDTYLRLTGKSASPLLRGAIAAGSIADPIVGRIVAPDALVEFLRDGWPNAVLPDRPPGTAGLSSPVSATPGRSSPPRSTASGASRSSCRRHCRATAASSSNCSSSTGAGSSRACACRNTCGSGWRKP